MAIGIGSCRPKQIDFKLITFEENFSSLVGTRQTKRIIESIPLFAMSSINQQSLKQNLHSN